MKRIFLLIATTLALAGCANRYDITMSNGTKITGVSKPVYHKDTGEYYFTDAIGRKMAVKEMRVRVIEPHQEEDQKRFKNVAPK